MNEQFSRNLDLSPKAGIPSSLLACQRFSVSAFSLKTASFLPRFCLIFEEIRSATPLLDPNPKSFGLKIAKTCF